MIQLIEINSPAFNDLIDRACERAVQVALQQLGGNGPDRWLTADEARKELKYKTLSGFYSIKPGKVLSTTQRGGRTFYSLKSCKQYMEDNTKRIKS